MRRYVIGMTYRGVQAWGRPLARVGQGARVLLRSGVAVAGDKPTDWAGLERFGPVGPVGLGD